MCKSINNNIDEIKKRIKEITYKLDKNVDDIEIIVVSKTVGYDEINQAIDAGMRNFGENRVQDLIRKHDMIDRDVKWHMIGHLQTNKVKHIIDKVGLIHSIDSLRLAEEINNRAGEKGEIANVLIQLNLVKEDSKFGIYEEDLFEFLDSIELLENITVEGLMTIAPYFNHIEKTRPIFRRMKKLFDIISERQYKNIFMRHLSMGMTNDYSIAIEEGANMIRLGTAIFNEN